MTSNSSQEAAPHIGLLCLSAIPDDPRVRRQGDLMAAAGWRVTAIGLPGYLSPAPHWTYLGIDEGNRTLTSIPGASHVRSQAIEVPTSPQSGVGTGGQPSPGTALEGLFRTLEARKLMPLWVRPVLRKAYLRLRGYNRDRTKITGRVGRLSAPVIQLLRRVLIVARALRIAVQPAYARESFWRANDRFERIYALARRQQVDLWLANDWTTLPIAARLAAEQGVPYGYDTHELAVDEYAQSLRWRLLHRPLIFNAEDGAIGGAAFVTCVSDGIADRLTIVHRLARRPVVIRNTPRYEAHVPRTTDETIHVLYHGVVSPGRGLEACIESVAQWRPEFTLTIRGPGADSYLAALKDIATRHNVLDRVVFAPPVPMTELVARATAHDVGLFVLPDYSRQNVYVLPNKFFEYAMAGLALVVSDLPEMARLLREHDLGVLVGDLKPETIAAALNSLDRPAIDRFKRNSLEAAKILNWHAEGQRLLDLCKVAVDGSRQLILVSAE